MAIVIRKQGAIMKKIALIILLCSLRIYAMDVEAKIIKKKKLSRDEYAQAEKLVRTAVAKWGKPKAKKKCCCCCTVLKKLFPSHRVTRTKIAKGEVPFESLVELTPDTTAYPTIKYQLAARTSLVGHIDVDLKKGNAHIRIDKTKKPREIRV